MSHPWKAQPYYMYRDPRTTGPVPQPMGAYVQEGLGAVEVSEALAGLRVQPALAGFTRGSFAPKSPWNVPGYVADQPTGVDGLGRYGFGDTDALGECESYATVKAAVETALQMAINEVSNATVKGFMTQAKGGIATALTNKIKSASETAADLQSQMKTLVKDAIKAVPPFSENPLGVMDYAINMAVDYFAPKLIAIPRVCAPAAGAPKATIDPGRWAMPAPAPAPSRPDINITGTLPQRTVGPSAYSKLLLSSVRLKTPPAVAPSVAVQPKAGVSTPVIIGAAALAALLLLR